MCTSTLEQGEWLLDVHALLTIIMCCFYICDVAIVFCMEVKDAFATW